MFIRGAYNYTGSDFYFILLISLFDWYIEQPFYTDQLWSKLLEKKKVSIDIHQSH